MDAPAKTRTRSPATGNFVVKSDNGDGSVTWVDTVTAEEITLHQDTPPTAAILKALAANGHVPRRPTLEDAISELGERELDDEPEEVEEESALTRVLTRVKTAALNGEVHAEVKIYRVRNDGTESYCGKFEIDEYDKHGDELIRAAFGAGKYRVRIYGPSMKPGTNYGKFVRLSNELIEIESSNIPLKASIPGLSDNGGHGMAGVMTILEKLTGEVVNLKQQQQGGISDALALLKQFKELGLMGAPAQSSNPLDEIKRMESLFNLRRTIKDEEEGGQEKPDTLIGLAEKALETIGPALQRGAQSQQVPALDIPAGFQHPQSEEQVNLGQSLILNAAVVGLLAGAARNDPVEKHASGIADMLPDELIPVLENPSWFEMLCELVPKHAVAMQMYRTWFTDLHAALCRELFDDEPKPVEVAAPVVPVTPVAAEPAPVARRTRKS